MKVEVATPPKSLLLTILLLNCLEFLQSGMIAFGAGPIMGEIGATPEEYSLAMACYASVAIITISKQRWLVERLGWRTFVLLSLGIFILGSAVCATSFSFHQFLVGRIAMGFGGAAFMTSARVIVNLIPPSPMRFVGIKYFATGLATGVASAPGLVALAVSLDAWNLIFIVLGVIAVVAGVFSAIALPSDLTPKDLRSQSHPILFMAIASGSFLILYVLQRSQYDFYSDIAFLFAGLSVAGFAVYYFLRSMHRHERPLIELRALMNPHYISGVGLFTVCYVVLGANNYIIPIFLQRALGFSWEIVGQFQTMGLFAALVAWLIMAWILPKRPGAKKFFVVGWLFLSGFGWQLSRMTLDADLWVDVLPALAANGVFLIVVMATTAMQTFRDVQHHEAVMSNAQQLKNMLGQLGMTFGISLAVIVVQWRTTEHYSALNGNFYNGHPLYTDSLQRLTALFSSGTGTQSAPALASSQLMLLLNQQATFMACLDYFFGVFAAALLCALVMAVQRLMK